MDVLIGRVVHFYSHLSVAVLELTGHITLGDSVLILGHTTEFTQQVSSLEIEHRKVSYAEPGSRVALMVDEPVREGDEVYRTAESVKSLMIVV